MHIDRENRGAWTLTRNRQKIKWALILCIETCMCYTGICTTCRLPIQSENLYENLAMFNLIVLWPSIHYTPGGRKYGLCNIMNVYHKLWLLSAHYLLSATPFLLLYKRMRSIAKVKTYTCTWASSNKMMAANLIDAAGTLAHITTLQLVKEHSTDSHEPWIIRSYLRSSHVGLDMVLIVYKHICIFVRHIFPYRLES